MIVRKKKTLAFIFTEDEVADLRYAISKAPSGGMNHSPEYNHFMRELKTVLGITWETSILIPEWRL